MSRTGFEKETLRLREKVLDKLDITYSDLKVPEYSYGITQSYIVSTFVKLIRTFMTDLMQAIGKYPGISKDWFAWEIDGLLQISITAMIDPTIDVDEKYRKGLEDLIFEFTGEGTKINISPVTAFRDMNAIIIQLDVENKKQYRIKKTKELKDIIDSIDVSYEFKQDEDEIRESVLRELI